MKNYSIRFALLLVTLILTQVAYGDVKIKSRQTMSGQSTESTTYIKGKRQRSEQNMSGMQMVNLTQCDLKRSVRLMPQSQTFVIDAWQTAPSVQPTTTTKQTQTTTKGGVINVTYTIKDTGERKQMFGYTAKHIITTMESVSSPDACNVQKDKMQFDGWYIDAAFALNCQSDQYANYHPNQAAGGCQDRYVTKSIGTAKKGYPVLEKMTMFDETGKETYSMLNEVLELSNTTLDAALFDVPSNFREVKDSAELYASMSNNNGNSMNNSSTPRVSGDMNSLSSSGINSTVQNLSKSSSNITSATGAKRAGIVRIGLANVKTGSVGDGLNAQQLAGAIQNTLTEYVKSPKIELVQLESKLASAIDQEAKQKECDFVVHATVSHKKGGGGGFGGMFKALAPVVSNVVPVAGGIGGSVAGQITSTVIYTASSAAANIKPKDEITLDIKLENGPATALVKQYKAKAKSGGEDIISPLVEQAAQAIFEVAAK